MIAITAAALITPLERIELPLLLVDGNTIAEVTSRSARQAPADCRVVDFPDAILAPGYLDIHIHGGGGHDIMESDPEVLPGLERLLAQHGVTAYVPTTVTAPLDKTLASLERLASAIEAAAKQPAIKAGLRARPIGIHIEGPFLSHSKRGVHPAEYLLQPSRQLFQRFWQSSRGHIKVMTIAPELEGALEVIEEATKHGVCVSLGHSDADMATTQAGIGRGARHATHTFNAMRPLDHRDPGILAAVLSDDRLSADIIADGIHVDPSVIKLFLRAKGPERAVLITDALSATGMPDGRYRLGSFDIEVQDGKCTAAGTNILAGSILTLDRAVRNVMQFAGWELSQAARLASLNPARALQVQNKGVLTAGADADLVVLNARGEVIRTVVGGVGL